MIDIKIGDLIRYKDKIKIRLSEVLEITKDYFHEGKTYYSSYSAGVGFGAYEENIIEVYRKKGNNYERIYPVKEEQEYLNHLRNAFAKHYDTKLQHPFNSKLYNFYLGMEQSVLASFNDFCKIFGIEDDIYKENGELNETTS